MNNTKDRSINKLKGLKTSQPKFGSGLEIKILEAEAKPLNDLTNEDLRILIGQNLHLEIIIPIAIERLQKNIFSEGDYYEGDLLKAVLESDMQYWKNNKDNWLIVHNLFNDSIKLLKKYNISDDIKKQWFDSYQIFKNIHHS